MFPQDTFEEWLDELFPDEEALHNSLLVKFPHNGKEVVISKNDEILGEGVPYYCVSKRFGMDVYCFVKENE